MKNLLIADAGATKTDWKAVNLNNDDSRSVASYSGKGFNPLHLSEEEIVEILSPVRAALGGVFDEIRFYGAGLGTLTMQKKMRSCLAYTFQCTDIDAQGDMLGAARALLGDRPGIACIMGTGSNSCHYDGTVIDFQPPSLGYILDDEGGGVAFGRRLLADIYKEVLPEEIRNRFEEKYNLGYQDLIENLYRRPAPNRWIAQFTHFLTENQEHPSISNLIDSQIRRFLDREFIRYPKNVLHDEGVSFAGSMAYIFKDRIETVFKEKGWRLGRIVRRPILELI